jgi:5-formyltetrahydrofolate cyclo-ligase
MTKTEIRIQYKQKRRKLSEAEKDKLEDLMLIQFQKCNFFESCKILSYAPISVQNEYDPYLAECFCMFKNRATSFAFPIVDSATETMNAFSVTVDTVFEKNIYGIAEPVGGFKIEPKEIELMFIPLLAFDKNGFRVGYGKGYYDKFIKLCNPNVVKVGFSFFDPIEIDDLYDYDKKLDFCITPHHTYTF